MTAILKMHDCDITQLLPLYEAVGWTGYTSRPEILIPAYRASLLTLGAFDEGRIVGVCRAVGDGVSAVLVQDILVLPEYQRRGIGTRLMRAMLDRFPNVYQLQLLTDDTERTRSFYTSLGLTDITGSVRIFMR